MATRMNRRAFLRNAGVASVAGISGPAVLGTTAAFAEALDGHRIFIFVSFSQAGPSHGLAQPRIGMQAAGTFKPSAHLVKGGGSYSLFDNAIPPPRPLVATGRWEATKFVSYTTKGLQPFGATQPGILVMKADVDGIGAGLTLRVVCNVGSRGPAGSTGEEEGWELETPQYGTFHQTGVGLSHLSIEGFSIPLG